MKDFLKTGEHKMVEHKLLLVAWEITRNCNLECKHCRSSSESQNYTGELSTADCMHVIDQILEAGKPVIILTGGEPLIRPDLFNIAEYAVSKGLRVVIGSNGTLISSQIAAKLKDIPISRIAVSLDFPDKAMQDRFRGREGAFAAAMEGIEAIRRAGIELQINCTLTRLNVHYLDKLLELSIDLGAVAFHPFFLVPTGRGKNLAGVELSAEQYEETLHWIYDKQLELGDKIFFKPTDAPHYLRIVKQRQSQSQISTAAGCSKSEHGAHKSAYSITRGCLAGTGFCFISHTGIVKGCGYLDLEAGNVMNRPFSEIWQGSPLFNSLRTLSNLKGKCGICEYKVICGGCRARAFEAAGDYLEPGPYCLYQPAVTAGNSANNDD